MLALIVGRASFASVLAPVVAALGGAATAADCPEAALHTLAASHIDLVLVDAHLPEWSAPSFATRVRQRAHVPLVFFSTTSTLSDRVRAFDAGADDYLSIDLDRTELERRLAALLRRNDRAGRRQSSILRGPEGIVMDVVADEVTVAGRRVALTPTEFRLLRILLSERGRVLNRRLLSYELWGAPDVGGANAVEAYVSRIRGKLARAGASGVIETRRGSGYFVSQLDIPGEG